MGDENGKELFLKIGFFVGKKTCLQPVACSCILFANAQAGGRGGSLANCIARDGGLKDVWDWK